MVKAYIEVLSSICKKTSKNSTINKVEYPETMPRMKLGAFLTATSTCLVVHTE
jgi:hypothetical protein